MVNNHVTIGNAGKGRFYYLGDGMYNGFNFTEPTGSHLITLLRKVSYEIGSKKCGVVKDAD